MQYRFFQNDLTQIPYHHPSSASKISYDEWSQQQQYDNPAYNGYHDDKGQTKETGNGSHNNGGQRKETGSFIRPYVA